MPADGRRLDVPNGFDSLTFWFSDRVGCRKSAREQDVDVIFAVHLDVVRELTQHPDPNGSLYGPLGERLLAAVWLLRSRQTMRRERS
jgi:hypothetical protein